MNEFRGHFEVTIDGKQRYVKFGHDELRQLDQLYGSTMKVMADAMESPLSMPVTFVMDALFIGLKHHGDPRLTKNKLQSIIPTHEVLKYAQPVVMALMLAYRGPEAFAEIVDGEEDKSEDAPPEGGPENPPTITAGDST